MFVNGGEAWEKGGLVHKNADLDHGEEAMGWLREVNRPQDKAGGGCQIRVSSPPRLFLTSSVAAWKAVA